jgi:hypothetical protein
MYKIVKIYQSPTENYQYENVSNMKTCSLDTERHIKKLDGKVVFATIATSSFREWNFHRYSIYKPDVLIL